MLHNLDFSFSDGIDPEFPVNRKCLWCTDLVIPGEHFCSDFCEKEYNVDLDLEDQILDNEYR